MCSILFVGYWAALNACPSEHSARMPMTAGSSVNVESASATHGEHHGRPTAGYALSSGDTATVQYEVTDVNSPVLSLVDAVATVTFSPLGAHVQMLGGCVVC